ncbi:amidohydrolase [Faecalicatena sp. AGMB00832]|uniref:Amidohydrolase n=1 Tax=Faecalicatena faecalis TaxID=2726362 RepID=A0ABS6D1W0_9FIRM|nr:amidohydrolase [Faecalicatena faecalis]MBU3875320.1 amidohydrolase [Faecalicatena faecalis]
MVADKIFYNGKFYTMAKEGETVEAIAVYNGKIAAAGTNEEVKAIGAKEFIDMKGQPILPGMADTHMHLYSDCLEQEKVTAADIHSFDELVERCKQHLDDVKEGDWLLIENLHMDFLKEGSFPTVNVLDQASTEIPICVGSFCHHVHMLNSKALELCNLGPDVVEHTPDTIDRFEDGSLTGVISDQSYSEYVEPYLPKLTMEENIEKVDKYLQYCSSVGLTQLHAYQEDNPDGIRMYQEMRKKKGLKCRVAFHFVLDENTPRNIVTGFGDDMLKLGSAKFLQDGSVGAASCLMNEPFADQPDNYGKGCYTQEELNKLVKDAYDAGHEVAVHAIGDKANDMLLTAIENAYRPELGWSRRFYMIHATVISESFIERAKKLPVIISIQPIFIRNYVSMARKRLGDERLHYCFALKDMMDAGLILTGGSDAPVCEVNPFHGIQCALTRMDLTGNPEIISKEQAISVYDAVSLYTRNAAYFLEEENLKGTLEVGKVADFVVTDKDIFETKAEEIASIKVLETVLGGDTVYQA